MVIWERLQDVIEMERFLDECSSSVSSVESEVMG